MTIVLVLHHEHEFPGVLGMAYVIGIGSTKYGKFQSISFPQFAQKAVENCLQDAKMEAPNIDAIYFGNCAMQAWGQANIRGHVALASLLQSERLPRRVPIVNVEAGCATGGAAFAAAYQAVKSQQADYSLAIGIEKLLFPNDPKKRKSLPLFSAVMDQVNSDHWKNYYHDQSRKYDLEFSPHPHRVMLLDIHALQAQFAIEKRSVSQQQIAIVAAKNRTNGKRNPYAQYRIGMTPAQVISDRDIIYPFTRSMCPPVSDGATAVLLCSDGAFTGLSRKNKKRALKVLGCGMAGGTMRDLAANSVTHYAAQKAYYSAGLGPAHIDIAEVHDSSAFCEIKHIESLGFCEHGGEYVQAGATFPSGERPVNVSGGLIAKGNPLGATGLGQIFEVAKQLRGEAGKRQVEKSLSIGLAHNAGGMIGLDEALSVVSILGRA